MDELWQRYRTFWTPVLIGLGVFLVGVIAVHVMTDDPEKLNNQLSLQMTKLGRKEAPSSGQIRAQAETAGAFSARNTTWATRLDQTAGLEGDLIEQAVDQSLRASLLRGASAQEAKSDAALAKHFDGSAVAAGIARRKFETMRQERIDLLRTADPNVGISRLMTDVYNELRVRANRADVDLRADRLGFTSMTSVDATTLPQRLLNLALVARIVNAAIVSGMETIDHIQIDRALPANSEAFMNEWWVRFVVTGPMSGAKTVLAMLSDKDAAVPLHDTTLSIPKGRSPLSGTVTLEARAYSMRVNLDTKINLSEEEEDA